VIKGLFFILSILLGISGFSQVGIHLKSGVSPWHITHNINELSSPISLGVIGGLNFEFILKNTPVGIVTGLDYLNTKGGTAYVDLSDQASLDAMVYAEVINEKYINVPHQEFSIPLMMVFYHNGFRTGIGAQYNRYVFENGINQEIANGLVDYGIIATTGARISKRFILSFGYYYGLSTVFNTDASLEANENIVEFNGRMQQFKIQLCISIFNNIKDSRYRLSPQ